jgi:hypothetical protein
LRACAGDCNDFDASVVEGSEEQCNGVDDDCDGSIPSGENDADEDGQFECEGDCDDHEASVFAGAPELCDGLDNDCDGGVEDEVEDGDGDGRPPCSYWDAGGEWVAGDDCDDTDAARFPGNEEICNGGIDDDCDEGTDEELDGDGDGETICEGDCDDGWVLSWTGGTEYCDVGDRDEDCDGLVDQEDPDAESCVWEEVECGIDAVCALSTAGEIACWGNPGDGVTSPPGGGGFLALAAGARSMCALAADGSIVCWGSNSSSFGSGFVDLASSYSNSPVCGQSPDALWSCDSNAATAPPAAQPFDSVSMNVYHGCGVLPGGSLECWGDDYGGRATPPSGEFDFVETVINASCAAASDGAVECWGADSPAFPVGAGDPILALVLQGNIEAGCALRSTGDLACFGVEAPPPGLYVDVCIGVVTRCAVTYDGSLVCWGSNEFGQATPP